MCDTSVCAHAHAPCAPPFAWHGMTARYDCARISADNRERVDAVAAALCERGCPRCARPRSPAPAVRTALSCACILTRSTVPRTVVARYLSWVASIYQERGQATRDPSRFEHALQLVQRAVQEDATCVEMWVQLNRLADGFGNQLLAMQCAKQMIALEPGNALYYSALAETYGQLGKIDEAIEISCKGVLLHAPPRQEGQEEPKVALVNRGWSNHCYMLNYSDARSPQEVGRVHMEWGRLLRQATGPVQRPITADTDPKRRLKIAYFSADLKTNVVAGCLQGILKAHDRDKVHVTCYQLNAEDDEMTEQLKALSDAWRKVAPMSADAVRDLIRADNIDILIELGGHGDLNRLDVLALCPAPIQVSWIGYTNTTGLDCVHYRITDGVCDPQDTNQPFTEELVRLPTFFNCLARSLASTVPIEPEPPLLKKGHVMFGSFNNLLKHSSSAKRAWARVLLQVENCNMMIKAPIFGHQSQVAEWETSFVDNATGVPGFNFKSSAKLKKKMIYKASTPSMAQHLALYNEMDIMLDSWPYSGTITTTEALLMGVPVITMYASGEASRHSQNVSASILTQVGLADLIAKDEDEFVRIASGLANNPDRLRELKQTLRSKALETIANPNPKKLCSEVEGDAPISVLFCLFRLHFQLVSLPFERHAYTLFSSLPLFLFQLQIPFLLSSKDAEASPVTNQLYSAPTHIALSITQTLRRRQRRDTRTNTNTHERTQVRTCGACACMCVYA